MICKRCGELVAVDDASHDCPHGKRCTGAVLLEGMTPNAKIAACPACRMRPLKPRRYNVRPGQRGLERHNRSSVDAKSRGETWRWLLDRTKRTG